MARNKVYLVICGMEGGYTPNSVIAFSTKASAQDYMKSEADFCRDNPYKVTGSARKGLYILDSGHSLNEYIMLEETTLQSCGMESYDDLETYNSCA